MSQFKFMSEVNSLLQISGPLTKGPQPRWERKGQENSLSLSNISVTNANTSRQKSFARTPTRGKKTPSKTPSKTPRKTPSTKTPTADRFIPVRSTSNFDLAHFQLGHDDDVTRSPGQKEIQKVMCENVAGNDLGSQRIFSFCKKAPTAPEGFQNPMRVIYTQTKTPASSKSNTRYIPQAPDRILDAPDIVDDYYLNLVDWSNNNVLAAALGAHVYLWNAATGDITELLQLPGNDYICSLAWIQEGEHLAVGTTSGTVELWDCARSKRLRVMEGHSARVGSLAWNSYILSTGCRSGQIIHHDVRQREHLVSSMVGHSQEVCGLKWSVDGKYLASGGNDNVLNVWQSIGGGSLHTGTRPLHVFTAHQAAVKALAWCPWQAHMLASGGGTADRHIRFWNCNTGGCVNAIDTKSQVCALLWSTNYKEIISGHGFANNELIIWKYPAMTKVSELTGHTARVLHLAMSPDGSTVLSAGADETLRLWKCFVKTPKEKKEVKQKASVFKHAGIR